MQRQVILDKRMDLKPQTQVLYFLSMEKQRYNEQEDNNEQNQFE